MQICLFKWLKDAVPAWHICFSQPGYCTFDRAASGVGRAVEVYVPLPVSLPITRMVTATGRWRILRLLDLYYMALPTYHLSTRPQVGKWEVGNTAQNSYPFALKRTILSLPSLGFSHWDLAWDQRLSYSRTHPRCTGTSFNVSVFLSLLYFKNVHLPFQHKHAHSCQTIWYIVFYLDISMHGDVSSHSCYIHLDVQTNSSQQIWVAANKGCNLLSI